MPLFKKKVSGAGSWVPSEDTDMEHGTSSGPGSAALMPTKGKQKKVWRVLTVRGRQEQEWLDSNFWQPLQETVIPAEAKAPLTVVYYGTYSSDGLRRDGAPGGAYSSIYDQYAAVGGDLYTRDEARKLKQWDTRKPFPGFDPKLGSKTLDIYSED